MATPNSCSRPEVAQEDSGEFERIIGQMILSLSDEVCPITGFIICVDPDECPGCKPIMEEMLRSALE
ncbi:MAG: hypothetical protein HZB92_04485 [Euryarchaeota archaeon]|nr:hypothetical protein [Euryarchaeota archaeon]